ncbi:MAG: hypothetical protein ACI9N1_001294 [Flavobacteriales bacterium]|jgi:hypothetical protein
MKMITSLTIVISILLVRCSLDDIKNEDSSSELKSIEVSPIAQTKQSNKIDSINAVKSIVDSLEMIRLNDSVEFGDQELINLQTQFLEYIKNIDFDQAQEMLYSKGLFYYTIGRIEKDAFNLKGIKKVKGILDGAYSYGENPEKIVSGAYWLDSITGALDEKSINVFGDYTAVGYGFTGNYSSDHIGMEGMFSGESGLGISADPPFRVVYSAYIRGDGYTEYLMLEFALENEEWKVYAIGNLEWTP